MKVQLTDTVSLAQQFPITDRLPGWFFRVTERSAGAYQGEGIDTRNRRVSADGNDAERVLADCVAMARAIQKVTP